MDYSITKNEKRILIQLCEMQLRLQRERLEVLEDDLLNQLGSGADAKAFMKSLRRIGEKLMATELIVDKLRKLPTPIVLSQEKENNGSQK